ncbi:MAG: DUF559 domain-containing protein [Actinobacteria bacterium]|nr:DUF559 domain-containing protein [Actinomycetota bacterium]MCA1720581.1 DUF559 domain-containing protein [Actinomycetota bacterium]
MSLEAALAESGRNQGLVTARELSLAGVSAGAVTRLIAARTLVRVRHGVYAPAALPPMPRFVVTDLGVAAAYVVHVRAALLSLGGDAVAAGRTAAALRGWPMLVEPGRSIEIDVPHGRGRAGGRHLRVTQRRHLEREQLVVLQGTNALGLAGPERTVIECCLTRPLLEAVALADSALRCGDATLGGLLRRGARLPGVRDSRRVRNVLRMVDEGSGSVLESVQRVRMLQAALSGFDTQVVLRHRPELRVDFCFRAQRLVVEVDGQKWHQDPVRDRLRDNALAALGWRVLRYTWAEVVHDGPRVLDEVRAALGRCPDIHLGTEESAAAA